MQKIVQIRAKFNAKENTRKASLPAAISSNGKTYFASMGLEFELLYTCITTTFAHRSKSFALMWTDCNGTNVSPSNLNPGLTLSSGSFRSTMSDVVIFAMSVSSSDESAFSSRERAAVGSHKIFSLKKIIWR